MTKAVQSSVTVSGISPKYITPNPEDQPITSRAITSCKGKHKGKKYSRKTTQQGTNALAKRKKYRILELLGPICDDCKRVI